MKRKLRLIMFQVIYFSFQVFSLQAQNYWAKIYGGVGEDSPWKIASTSNSGFAIEGRTRSFGSGSEDFLFFTADSNGTSILQKVFSAPNLDEPYAMTATSDGGYLIAGNSSSFGEGSKDILFLKLNASGKIDWQKSIGGNDDESALSVVQTSDGGYIAVGWTFSVGAGGTDAWIVKISPDGNLEWQKAYGGTGYEFAYSIIETNDGGFLFVGNTDSSTGKDNDVWVVKLNNNGDVVWQKTYGGTNEESARAVRQNPDGTYTIGAWSKSFGNGSSDFWLLKLNSDGSILWQKSYLTQKDANFFAFERTKDNGFILVGGLNISTNSNPDYDFFVVRIDEFGSPVWKKTYGGSGTDQASTIAASETSGFLVAGWTFSFDDAMASDILVLKIDEDGNLPNGLVNVSNANLDTLTTNIEPKEQNFIVTNTNQMLRETQLEESDVALKVKTLNTLEVDEEVSPKHPDIQILLNFPGSFVAPMISVALQAPSFVNIKIYDFIGNELATVYNGFLDNGVHSFELNLSGFASGLYFAVVTYKFF